MNTQTQMETHAPSNARLGWCYMKALAQTAKHRFAMMRMYYR